jgi:hypothetical protein
MSIFREITTAIRCDNMFDEFFLFILLQLKILLHTLTTVLHILFNLFYIKLLYNYVLVHILFVFLWYEQYFG